VESTPDNLPSAPVAVTTPERPVRDSWLSAVGLAWIGTVDTVERIAAFTVITLGTTARKWNTAPRVVRPLIRQQIARSGVRVLPIVAFLGLALGFVFIGQTVALLSRVGATNLTGVLLVSVLVRELCPITAALVVLARVGTATVVELGTMRAMGEVEALEALGIDPIHYVVVPRLIGLTLSIFALTVYLVLIAVLSGFAFVFLQQIPLSATEYFKQIGAALRWHDFVLLALKTGAYGTLTSLIICYHGLAQPLRLEEVASATTRTVAQCVVAYVLIDALFIVTYLFL
jgi:phospholipid/cholesterol/gamma-HCH transport system permease protein